MNIREIRNPHFFQSLCQQLIIADYADAQIVDDSRGDQGIDIYVPSTETLYAIYCPGKDLTQVKTIKDKIRSDIKKAAKLKISGKYKINKFVFITPAPLIVDLQTYLNEQADLLGFKASRNISEKHLVDIFTRHKRLRSQFPDLIVADLENQIEDIRQSFNARLDEQYRQPILTIEFADLKNHQVLGKKIILSSKVVKIPVQSSIPNYRGNTFGIGDNIDYYRDLAEYIQKTSLIKEIGFALINSDTKAARDITIELLVSKNLGLVIQSNSDYPPFPSSSITGLGLDISRFLSAKDNSIDIRSLSDKWIITADFKKVRPTETVFSEIPFLVGSNVPQTLELEAIIRAENLSEPIKCSLMIEIKTSAETLTFQDIIDWEFED